ncbi:MAG: sugar phosphate isomerase/epimerase [Chitinophagaceae bacterium]|nr:sugar phosphate isomerase/epimerase [Chitinophagaceae bacterium]
MKIKYACPFWGQEHLEATAFVAKVIDAEFDGIEINLPAEGSFTNQFLKTIENIRSMNPEFVFIAQAIVSPVNNKVDEYRSSMERRLQQLVSFQPDFINAHTGKDHYSFDDNCRIIETCMNISAKSGISILHETHRGRFSFHATTLIPYLEKFPELKLVGDLSHFCVVSESLLQDQETFLQKIFPHILHLHARIGHEQSPQVSDPFAPEWKGHLKIFLDWWKEIILCNHQQGNETFTICPEFGPTPYMPAISSSEKPIAYQWKINSAMKNYLRENLTP